MKPEGVPAEPVARMWAHGTTYMLSTGAQVLALLLAVPVATRLLRPEEYGTVAIALVLTQIVGYIAGLGLSAAVSRELFIEDRSARTARGLVGATLVAALLVTLAFELTGPLWAGVFRGLEYGLPLRVATWTALPFAVAHVTQTMLRSQQRVRRSVVVAVLSSAGGHGLAIFGVVLGARSAETYLVGVAVGWAAAASLGAGSVGVTGEFFRDVALRRRALRAGLPAMPHLAATYVLVAGDRVLVERLLGVAEAGRYQVAYQVGAIGMTIVAAFNNGWQPVVHASAEDARADVLASTAAEVHRAVRPLLVAIALLTPLGLVVAAPDSYVPAELLAPALVVSVTLVPFLAYLGSSSLPMLHGRTWIFAIATPLAAALNIALNLLLIPRWGLIGAAAATVVAYAGLAASVAALARDEVPWRRAQMAITLTVAVGAATLSAVMPTGPGWMVARAGLGVAVGLGALRPFLPLLRRR